jgi:hypothetical protein
LPAVAAKFDTGGILVIATRAFHGNLLWKSAEPQMLLRAIFFEGNLKKAPYSDFSLPAGKMSLWFQLRSGRSFQRQISFSGYRNSKEVIRLRG